jgi:predicted Zn-dependent protease
MKHSLLKDIVFSAVVVLFSVGGYQYMEENNWDWKALFTGDLFKQRPVETTSMGTYDDVMYVYGLGNVSKSKLELVKQSIEDYYGVPCVIEGNVDIKSNFYHGNSGMLDVNVLLNTLGGNEKTLYVTDKKLFDTDTDKEVLGLTLFFGKTLLVTTKTLKSTAIHEYGHTLGLDHCHNEGCAMTDGDGEELCSECINEIKFKNKKWSR